MSAVRPDVAPPLLRGWLHLICFFAAIPTAAMLILDAGSARARVAGAVYAVGLIALFGVSGIYHRGRWSQAARLRMKRLDHATIFVMIAGSYTPLCLLAMRGTTAVVLLVTAWAGAAAGCALALLGVAERRVLGLVAYIGLGWAALLGMPQLLSNLSGLNFALIVVGGVLYTAGAIILGTRWPNPSPRLFGYHEVWHVMVVGGVVCHLIPIAAVVQAG